MSRPAETHPSVAPPADAAPDPGRASPGPGGRTLGWALAAQHRNQTTSPAPTFAPQTYLILGPGGTFFPDHITAINHRNLYYQDATHWTYNVVRISEDETT